MKAFIYNIGIGENFTFKFIKIFNSTKYYDFKMNEQYLNIQF